MVKDYLKTFPCLSHRYCAILHTLTETQLCLRINKILKSYIQNQRGKQGDKCRALKHVYFTDIVVLWERIVVNRMVISQNREHFYLVIMYRSLNLLTVQSVPGWWPK